MSASDDAAAALTGKVYAEAVTELGKEAHRAILDFVKTNKMRKAEFEVVGDGGESYGTVRWSDGRKTPKVTDPDALLKWVLERYPDEVRDVPTIREAFLARLLKEAADATHPDGLPPGVEVAVGDPFLTITPTADARARAREVVVGQGRPALPGLETSTTE